MRARLSPGAVGTTCRRCGCGRPACRQLVDGRDWTESDLQERYRGYFS